VDVNVSPMRTSMDDGCASGRTTDEEDGDYASGTPGERDGSPVTASDGELSPPIEDAWVMGESPGQEIPPTQTPPMRVSARVAWELQVAFGVFLASLRPLLRRS